MNTRLYAFEVEGRVDASLSSVNERLNLECIRVVVCSLFYHLPVVSHLVLVHMLVRLVLVVASWQSRRLSSCDG